jgi:membrane protein implicated in regulation of membrane protease activity
MCERFAMTYLFLTCFIVGVLLSVRLLFFGAERRRLKAGALPLRRSEPAALGFLVMFGLAGYLAERSGRSTTALSFGVAVVLGGVWAYVVTRLAIATARVEPEVNPDDPRFAYQGCVAVVTAAIVSDGDGEIRFDDHGAMKTSRARNIGNDQIDAGEEVCIERIEDGVAYVERWSLVEERL